MNGGGAAEARDAIAGAEIEPFIDWDIQRPGDWKISGEVTIKVDKDGVKSAGGKLKVEKGPFEGSLGGEADRDGRLEHHAPGQVDAGEKPKTEECPLDELYFPYEYECELERDIAATKKPVKKTRRQDKFPEHKFVYFKYASDEINPKLTTKADLDALESLMAGGYKVTTSRRSHRPRACATPPRSGRRATRRCPSAAPTRRCTWPPSTASTAAASPATCRIRRTSSCSRSTSRTSTNHERGRRQGARGPRHPAVGDRPRRRRAEDAGGREARGVGTRPQGEGRGDLRVPAPRPHRPRARPSTTSGPRTRSSRAAPRSPRATARRRSSRRRSRCGGSTAWFAREPPGGPDGLIPRPPHPSVGWPRINHRVGAHALDHEQVALRLRALAELARSAPTALSRSASSPAAATSGPVPRAALRHLAPRGRAALPARSEGRLLLRARPLGGHRARDRRAARRQARRRRGLDLRRGRRASRAVLGASTIADVVERENREAGATMHYI